jgi:hypothetical protein
VRADRFFARVRGHRNLESGSRSEKNVFLVFPVGVSNWKWKWNQIIEYEERV